MNNLFYMYSDGQRESKKIGRVFFEAQPKRFVLVIDFGMGAGYIGGGTLYVARNSGSRAWQLRNRGKADHFALFGFELGFTRNGNRIPYLSH